MAKTLMGTGLAPERAYELARLIERELRRHRERQSASEERVYDVLRLSSASRRVKRPSRPSAAGKPSATSTGRSRC